MPGAPVRQHLEKPAVLGWLAERQVAEPPRPGYRPEPIFPRAPKAVGRPIDRALSALATAWAAPPEELGWRPAVAQAAGF